MRRLGRVTVRQKHEIVSLSCGNDCMANSIHGFRVVCGSLGALMKGGKDPGQQITCETRVIYTYNSTTALCHMEHAVRIELRCRQILEKCR